MDPARLKSIDLFAALPEDELGQLAALAHEKSVPEGEELVKAGTWPYQLFAIEEGTVEVRRDEETVVATAPVTVILFAHTDVDRLRKSVPDLDERLQAILDERSE